MKSRNNLVLRMAWDRQSPRRQRRTGARPHCFVDRISLF